MSFNIKAKALSETTFVHLRDPATDEKLYDEATGEAVGITIYGKASSQYKQALSALSRKNLARKGKPQSFETNMEDNIEILVTISKEAKNLDIDGVPVATAAAFKALYSDTELFWVKDQVQEALEDNAAFTQK